MEFCPVSWRCPSSPVLREWRSCEGPRTRIPWDWVWVSWSPTSCWMSSSHLSRGCRRPQSWETCWSRDGWVGETRAWTQVSESCGPGWRSSCRSCRSRSPRWTSRSSRDFSRTSLWSIRGEGWSNELTWGDVTVQYRSLTQTTPAGDVTSRHRQTYLPVFLNLSQHQTNVMQERSKNRRRIAQHGTQCTLGSVEQGLLVVLPGRDSRDGAEIFLLQEWVLHPCADRVILSLVMGCRKPILLSPWCSRMDWKIGIRVAIISSAVQHANRGLNTELNKNKPDNKLNN